ncbi:MAG: hypothetical protein ABIQ44_09450, partial [Chloroflexia bacterium]
MGNILLYLIPAIAAIAILGGVLWIALPKRNTVSIEARLSNFAERPRSLEELELEQPFTDRVLKPLIAGITRALGKLTPAQGMEKVKHQLILAGQPYNMGTSEFMGARIMAMVILG